MPRPARVATETQRHRGRWAARRFFWLEFLPKRSPWRLALFF